MDMSTWQSVLSSLSAFLSGDFWRLLFSVFTTGKTAGLRSAISLLLALVSACFPALDKADELYLKNHPFVAASPVIMSKYENMPLSLVEDADFYVSPSGNDSDDGSFSHPFKTPAHAAQAVRQLDKTGKSGVTVAFMAGEYRINGLTLTSADGGTARCPVTWRAYGDGEVVFNGGVSVLPSDFSPVADGDIKDRLSGEAKQKVLEADLSLLGLNAEDYGKICAIGTYHTASMYSGDYVGPVYSELFVNDERCPLARYPDVGYIYAGEVTRVNDARFLKDGTANPSWGTVSDPVGESFLADGETAERIARYKTLDDVWMMGYWKYDWADGSTPVYGFNAATGELTMRFASFYGIKEGAPYYIFNCLEELSSPGEWYLDRENAKLYLYPPDDFENADIDLSLSTSALLTLNGASHFDLIGITFKGTRADAVVVNGDNVTVSDCVIKNVSGTALRMAGTGNTAENNEITRTGRGGIYLSGGDEASLTPGNNRAVNNLIHDWSEIYTTYQPAVSLYGVGNVCEHNEIFNSPHEAITYSGNNNRIAYNVIHDVCLNSSDAGAVYAGRSWISYGNEILFNCIYDLGSGDFTPNGIYMDDALSGQRIYGNLLVNIPGNALMLGGGRDLDVRNNVIVSGGERGIYYDQRAIDGFYGGWFEEQSGANGNMWAELRSSPWKTQLWQTAFPQMARISDDFSSPDDPSFAANPANSLVKDNIFVTGSRTIGLIDEMSLKYSEFSGNLLFKRTQMSSLFTDHLNGDYSIKEDAPVFAAAPSFEPLPVTEMGRTGK